MPERINYARQQAVDAYQRASDEMDNRVREEWLKAARLWEQIIEQYEWLLKSPGSHATTDATE